MKTLTVLIVVAATACPLAAQSDPSFDVATLAHMKAVLDVCSRSSPEQATAYLLQMKSMIGDATKATVDAAIKTEEYQQTYQSTRSEFDNLTPEGVAKACTTYLATTR